MGLNVLRCQADILGTVSGLNRLRGHACKHTADKKEYWPNSHLSFTHHVKAADNSNGTDSHRSDFILFYFKFKIIFFIGFFVKFKIIYI